jgi:hypothetical protein
VSAVAGDIRSSMLEGSFQWKPKSVNFGDFTMILKQAASRLVYLRQTTKRS